MNSRRKYSTDFKRMLVDAYLTTGKTQAELEREYGVGASCICRWVRELQTHKEEAFPGHGQLRSSEAEVAAMRRQLEDQNEQITILKKALRLVAQSPQSDSL